MRTKITLAAAAAAALVLTLCLTSCGSGDATGGSASGGIDVAISTPPAVPNPVASTSDPARSSSPTTSKAPDHTEGGWYDDFDHRDDVSNGVWVAAWFVPGDAMPDSIVRWWRVVDLGTEPTPRSLMVGSIRLLDELPPEGMSSAFGAGLEVLDVEIDGSQVVLDLAADSPGLYGHGSAGAYIGESQLIAAAAHYFPDAETLCVTYDGVPTDAESGGTFLHDMIGCPLALG